MDELLLEPLKYYEQVGREAHEKNTIEYFDNLLKESGVNLEENRSTVKAYNTENTFIEQIAGKISKYKLLRGLLIAAIVIGAIMLLISLGQFPEAILIGIILILLGAGFIAGSIVLMVKKINPLIKDSNAVKAEHEQKAQELLQKAHEQMAPLNALFDNVDTFRIIEKTIPEFSFDNKYTKEHEAFLTNQYDFLDLSSDETTMQNTLAGRFKGNPFLYCQRLVHEMRTATYTGSLTITWTETYRDSSGHLQTRRKSETLYASVTKPKPEFYSNTYLTYGNQAAPELNFTRSPQHSETLNEKELRKKVKSGEKDLKKMARMATKEGGTFQEMANSEFEVLFGAQDRDNEVQFRLMFTPLAQRNTVALVTNKIGYGDDFYFNKHRRFNIITSEHAQNWNMLTSPNVYYSYDVDTAKLNFINFNTNYFKSIFFDFAPLFSVPAYLEEPCASLAPVEDYDCNYTCYEHEVMANAIGQERFAHRDSHTESILKTAMVGKQGNADIVNVTAYSYTTVERTDFVPVKGGDGHYHNVPVEWIEYIPISNSTNMKIEAADLTENEYSAAVAKEDCKVPVGTFFHGLVANIIED